jgi:hypothetical protein
MFMEVVEGGVERCVALVRVGYEAPRALLEAVHPDNIMVPQWLSISCRSAADAIECVVDVDCSMPSRVLSLRSTLDDLLRSINVGINVIEGSKKVKKA